MTSPAPVAGDDAGGHRRGHRCVRRCLQRLVDLSVLAVEPSAAMRDQIPRTPAIQVLAGPAGALPLPDASADAAWLSLVLHHIPDLGVAAHEIRRVLRPGSPVLIRQGFPGRLNRVELVRWLPETARTVATYPSVEDTCKAFAAAGFHQDALEQVPETYPDQPRGLPRPGGHVPPRRHHDAQSQ